MSHPRLHSDPPKQPSAAELENAATSTANERYRATVRVTVIGAVVDLLLGVAKIVVGIIGHSQALVADGIHSLSDLLTDGFVLYAAKHANREADAEHPYGHGRIETLATQGLGVALIGVAIGIGIDAVRELIHPTDSPVPGWIALAVATTSIFAKEAIYHYTMHIAKRHRSNMLRANAWHSRTDAISSIIVVIGVAGSMAGWVYLDSLAAVGVAVMIAKIGWDLAWNSMQELADRGLDPEEVEEIKGRIKAIDGVTALHLLRTRRMGPDVLVDVHIQVDPSLSVSEGHHISENVRNQLISSFEEIADVMVHIDPEDDEREAPSSRLPLRQELVDQLMHDWQNIEGADQVTDINLHYLNGKVYVDLVLPLELVQNDAAAKQRLAAAFNQVAARVDPVAEIRLFYC